MKKYILPIVIVVVFGAYALFSSKNSGTPTTPGTATSTGTGSTDNTAETPPSGLKDGTYNGSVTDAFYGPMQVAAIVKNGKLVDVQFLKFPNDQGESIEVNSRSNPILKQEAIAAQSANVNIVSGATQSSEAFSQSLAQALAQAQS